VEEIGKSMLLVHHPGHLRPLYFESGTSADSCGCREAASHGSRNRLSNRVTCNEKGECGFFTRWRNHCQLGETLLQVEDGMGFASLRKECLTCLQLDDASSQYCTRQKISAPKFRCFGGRTRGKERPGGEVKRAAKNGEESGLTPCPNLFLSLCSCGAG
jgi:hypothetical protein